MKRTIRNNINQPYTLHDRSVIAFEVRDSDIVMRTQSGILETTSPYRLIDGFVEFHDVKWDFSYVYLLGVTGKVGYAYRIRFYNENYDEIVKRCSACRAWRRRK